MQRSLRASRKYVIRTTMKTLGLSKKDAIKRVDALLKSGILDDGSPDDRMTQLLIENFLRFNLDYLEKELGYEVVLASTIRFPELVDEYDKRYGQHLGKVLDKIDTVSAEEFKEQIQEFDKFFCEKIWNRFPGVTKH